MKKSLISLAILSLSAAHVQADTLLGVYAGAQGWNMEASGGFSTNSTLQNFNFEDKTQGSFYVALEHFVPLVPNVKVRQTSMDTSGNTDLTVPFTFAGKVYGVNDSLNTQVDLSATDATLYYELFDNDLLSFDFGLTAKYIDGTLMVENSKDASINSSQSFSGVVPMAYSRIAVGLPLTGWGVYAEGNYLSIDSHSLLEYQAAITYTVVDNLAVDVDIQLGYRAFELELDDLDDISTDLSFKGPFAGIEVHF